MPASSLGSGRAVCSVRDPTSTVGSSYVGSMCAAAAHWLSGNAASSHHCHMPRVPTLQANLVSRWYASLESSRHSS